MNINNHYSLWADIEYFQTSHKGKRLSSSELKEIFILYKNLRQTYRDPISNLDILNGILRYIMEEAYRSNEEDSCFIVELIHALVDNDVNINFLLPNLVHFSICTFPDYPTLMEFILYHSTRLKALFSEYRLVALPSYEEGHCISSVELALKLQSPSLLQCLLRYGAIWSYLEGYGERVRYQWTFQGLPCPSTRLCADIISHFVKSFIQTNPKFKVLSELTDASSRCCEDLISCGRLILRDTPTLEFKFLFSMDYRGRNTISEKEARNIIEKLDIFLPGVMKHFTSPMPLKHSCKMTIRKVLNYNWQLPCGIYKLPLPSILKSYLDLHCD